MEISRGWAKNGKRQFCGCEGHFWGKVRTPQKFLPEGAQLVGLEVCGPRPWCKARPHGGHLLTEAVQSTGTSLYHDRPATLGPSGWGFEHGLGVSVGAAHAKSTGTAQRRRGVWGPKKAALDGPGRNAVGVRWRGSKLRRVADENVSIAFWGRFGS